MKKILLPILALGGLLFASSCQMDEPDAGTLTGEVNFSISAGIPGSINTYSPEDGEAFSHLGGANNVDPASYDLRYKLEVYDENGKLAYTETKFVKENFISESVVFDARLIAKKYKFVFWADFLPENWTTDYYYSTESLTGITYNRTPEFADDAMDAYTKVVEMDLSAQSQNITDIILQRPFGKLRLIATDQLSGNLQDDELPMWTELIYAENTTVPDFFNALEGEALATNGYYSTIWNVTSVSVPENALVNQNTYPDSYFLIANYILASDATTGYSMDVNIYDQYYNTIGVRSLSQIPIVRNKLTTVIGNFYSNEGSLEIIVEDIFEDQENIEELEDLVFPEAGKVLLTIGDHSYKYETISDALGAIQGESEAIITLAASDYEESIIVPDGGNIRIVGQKGTKVKDLLSDNSGKMTVENIEFYGTASEGQASVTIGDGASGSITLKNCTLAPLDDNTRPLHYYAGSTASLTVEGCTVTSKVAHPFFNPSDKSGKLVLRDNTFNGTSISAEFKNGNDDQNEAYPVIEGNTFMTGPGVEFSYYFAGAPERFSDLNDNTKKYVYSIINNNTFNSESEPNVTIWQNGTAIITVNKNEFKVSDENGIKYASIMDAINLYGSSEILLPVGTYDEVINIPDGRNITILGEFLPDNKAIVNALMNTGSGNVAVHDVAFTGGTNGVNGSEDAAIYFGNGNIELYNCTIAPDGNSPDSRRPIITRPGASGLLYIENCTIDASNCLNSYLNEASYSYTIQLIGNTFKGNSISAEFRGSQDGNIAYPYIVGNTFEYGPGVEFTYWTDQAVTEYSQLDEATRQYCDIILYNNTFLEQPNVKVWPTSGSPFEVNMKIVDIEGSYSISGNTLYITADPSDENKYWVSYFSENAKEFSATRNNNTLTVSNTDVVSVDAGSDFGEVSAFMCAFDGSYLYPEEQVILDFSEGFVTATNGIFLGFDMGSGSCAGWMQVLEGTTGTKNSISGTSQATQQPLPVNFKAIAPSK